MRFQILHSIFMCKMCLKDVGHAHMRRGGVKGTYVGNPSGMCPQWPAPTTTRQAALKRYCMN